MNASDAAELRRASVRLAVRFAAVILVLFAILIAVTFVIVRAGQIEATESTLVNAGLVDSPKDAPPDVLVAIHADGETLLSRDAPSWFPISSPMSRVKNSDDAIRTTKTFAGHTFAVRTSSHDGRIVQTALDTHEDSEELARLTLGLIVAGVLAVIGSGVIAALMARRAMRPMLDALALQRRFVTDASHELRMPLTLLSTRAQLLRRQVFEEPRTPHPADSVQPSQPSRDDSLVGGLDEILQDSRDLTEILEDLLIAADPRESVETSELDLASLADEVVASLRLDAESHGIVLSRTGEKSDAIVMGARTSLRRLYAALVSNALDHASSQVTVEVHVNGKHGEIRVSDDGSGFADGMTERAFDRFATSRTARDESGGTRHYGLGLALVAEVAARHGGSVAIEAVPPAHGASIKVTLPLSDR